MAWRTQSSGSSLISGWWNAGTSRDGTDMVDRELVLRRLVALEGRFPAPVIRAFYHSASPRRQTEEASRSVEVAGSIQLGHHASGGGPAAGLRQVTLDRLPQNRVVC